MIVLKEGNLFDSNCETLVNAVNCVGVMVKGIALTFKLKFPKMYDKYRKDCLAKKIKIGDKKGGKNYRENNIIVRGNKTF